MNQPVPYFSEAQINREGFYPLIQIQVRLFVSLGY